MLTRCFNANKRSYKFLFALFLFAWIIFFKKKLWKCHFVCSLGHYKQFLPSPPTKTNDFGNYPSNYYKIKRSLEIMSLSARNNWGPRSLGSVSDCTCQLKAWSGSRPSFPCVWFLLPSCRLLSHLLSRRVAWGKAQVCTAQPNSVVTLNVSVRLNSRIIELQFIFHKPYILTSSIHIYWMNELI